MSFKNIEKWSFGYWLLKNYSRLFHHFFYSEIFVKGRGNIPKNKPFIFALNHQNALMDALAVLYTYHGQMIFLARADIFKKPVVAKLLYFLKILPIYRIRDGYSSLQKNDEIFDKTIDVLKSGKPLAMLPEGTHEALKHLRPFKKGLARIAFAANEALGNDAGLSIIPVGIDYDNYYNFNNKLIVTYGKPIPVSDFTEIYKENPAKGLIDMTNTVHKALTNLMIHVENPVQYQTIIGLAWLYALNSTNRIKNYYQRFLQLKEMVSHFNHYSSQNPDEMKILEQDNTRYYAFLKGIRLSNITTINNKFDLIGNLLESILLIILLPVFFAGYLLNILPYLSGIFATKKIEDKVFHNSVKFTILQFIYPIYTIILAVTFYLFIHDGMFSLFFLVGLPLTGLFAFHYLQESKNLFMKWHYFSLLLRQDERLMNLLVLKKELLKKISNIIANKSM